MDRSIGFGTAMAFAILPVHMSSAGLQVDPDSTYTELISQSWNLARSEWQNETRQLRKINEHDREIESVKQTPQGDGWINDTRVVTEYTDAGETAEIVTSEWVGGQWQNVSRNESIYDAQGRPIERTWSGWDGSGWYGTQRIVWAYDQIAGDIIETTQVLNLETWVDMSRRVDILDDHANLLSRTYYGFSSFEVDWVPSLRALFQYDSASRRIEQLAQSWASENWLDTSRQRWEYDNAGNVTKHTTESWNLVFGWTYLSFFVYGYDAHGQLIEIVTLGDGITPLHRTLFEYDDSQNMTERREQTADGGMWRDETRLVLNYNEDGNLQSQETQSRVGSSWISGDKLSLKYDQEGRLVLEASHYWDGFEWIDDTKTVYGYEGGIGTGLDDSVPASHTSEVFREVRVFPNPFSGGVQISFVVSQHDRITVSIFDGLGRKVGELHDGPVGEGRISLTWTPGDLAQGVYFCLVQAAGHTWSRPVVFAR